MEFTGADLAALEPATDLAEALHALERSGIVRPAPTAGSWAFRHTLLREAAYGTQVRETRQANHARIADHLVAHSHAPLDPALVATHLDLAGRPLEAVGQYLAAAQAAQSTGAHAEAQRMLGRVLELTEQLGDHPNRSLLEVMAYGLRVLSTASVEGYGSPDAAVDLDRVERLAKKLGARPEVLPSLVAVWSARFTLGHLASSRALLEHMEELVADPALAWFAPEVEACAGYQLLYEGRLELAAAELRRSAEGFGARPLEQVLSPFWPLPNDPCAVAHAALMTIAVLDGDLDTKERHRELALARADAVAFPRGAFSRCFVDVYDAWTHLVTDEPAMARDRGASAADLAGRHGLSYFLVLGGIYRYAAPIGWTEAESVDPDGARSVVATTELLGHRSFRPAFLANLAMVLWRAGDENGARRTVADALRTAEKQGEELNVPYVHRVAAHIDAVKDPVRGRPHVGGGDRGGRATPQPARRRAALGRRRRIAHRGPARRLAGAPGDRGRRAAAGVLLPRRRHSSRAARWLSRIGPTTSSSIPPTSWIRGSLLPHVLQVNRVSTWFDAVRVTSRGRTERIVRKDWQTLELCDRFFDAIEQNDYDPRVRVREATLARPVRGNSDSASGHMTTGLVVQQLCACQLGGRANRRATPHLGHIDWSALR